ncbi:hypothetical protein GALMADRAFT_1127071 [Galerina marginata CBS 339.88]|uniref:Transmembrane protein n=1 Tax=Galerina marginata (strain CBS 339.88) TaxID=685588 RepID=A0A067SBD1_GALM3|nr:hypothetical protein GALMADRAFT_1127071 [Galerina marginata CBS 339.88]
MLITEPPDDWSSSRTPSTLSGQQTPLMSPFKSDTFDQFLSTEKDLEIRSLPLRKKKKNRRRRRYRSSLRSCIGAMELGNVISPEKHPIFIIICQVTILAAAWSFFFLCHFVDIPLPFTLAVWARDNPHLLTLTVTLLATAISAISSFCFSLSIRYAVNHYLIHRSLTIFALGASIKILNRSFIFNLQHLFWSCMAIATILTAGTQTAGWSTLLTPVDIILYTRVAGVEFDITNEAFLLANLTMSPPAVAIDAAEFSGFTTALGRATNTSSVVTCLGRAYNDTTSGISPANLSQINTDKLQRSVVHPIGNQPFPKGFSETLTINDHQGFTVDVSCRESNGIDSDSSQLNWSASVTDSMLQPGSPTGDLVVTIAQVSRQCGATTKMDSAIVIQQQGPYDPIILGIACPEGGNNYSLVADSVLAFYNGSILRSSPTLVCDIVPHILSVETVYDGLLLTNTNLTVHPGMKLSILTEFLMSLLEVTISKAINLRGSLIGGVFAAVKADLDPLSNVLWEPFIQSLMEFHVTMLRDALSSSAYQSWFDKPGSLRNITGILQTKTIGYTRQPTVLAISLLPITCVGLASILGVVFVLIQQRMEKHRELSGTHPDSRSDSSRNIADTDQHGGQLELDINHDEDALVTQGRVFDVGDPLHLLAVASAGGITGVFGAGINETQLRMRHTVELRLGKVTSNDDDFQEDSRKGRIGLVHQ